LSQLPQGLFISARSAAGPAKTLFDLEPRSRVEAKHQRTHEMFFLNRLKPEFSSDQDGREPNESFGAEYDRLTSHAERAIVSIRYPIRVEQFSSLRGAKRRSNPGAAGALVPLDCFASLAMTGLSHVV